MSMYKVIAGGQRAIRRFSKSVNVRRHPVGSYDANGRWTQGTLSAITIDAAVQPITGEDLRKIAEGRNIKYAISVHTVDALNGADVENKIQPDQVEYDSKWFEVDSVRNWDGVIEATAVIVEV